MPTQQVFHPDQLYKAVSVVLRQGALGPDRRAVRPRPMRRRRRPLLQLCDAVYTLRRTYECALPQVPDCSVTVPFPREVFRGC